MRYQKPLPQKGINQQEWDKRCAVTSLLVSACKVKTVLKNDPYVDYPIDFIYRAGETIMEISYLPHWQEYKINGFLLDLPTSVDDIRYDVNCLKWLIPRFAKDYTSECML